MSRSSSANMGSSRALSSAYGGEENSAEVDAEVWSMGWRRAYDSVDVSGL